MELSTILEELRALRLEVVALQRQAPKNVQKTKCQGVTGKGTPCCNGAVFGTDFCKMHTGMIDKPQKVPRVPRTPKPKKIQPEHTHGIGEDPGECELCQTHGDVIDPELPYIEFDGDSMVFPESDDDMFLDDDILDRLLGDEK